MGLCAGYDAGIDFYISPQEIKKNPKGDRILEEVKKWETVRMTQVLSEEQKKQVKRSSQFLQVANKGWKGGIDLYRVVGTFNWQDSERQ